MKKIVKLFSLVVLTFLMVVTLASCNKVTGKNYEKIQPEMTKAAVVEILGEANDTTTLDDYVEAYWFKGAKTVAEANEKVANGKKVTYIKVVMHDNTVLNATYGDWKLE